MKVRVMSDDTTEVGDADVADGMEWYVLKVASNRERTIKKSLRADDQA